MAYKIALVLDDTLDTPDGIQQYVLGVGEWLSEQGHDVHYLVGETSRSDRLNIHSMSRNLKVRFNGNRLSMSLLSNKRKLRAFMQEQQFDIVHVQVPYSPFMAHRVIMAAGSKTGVVGTFHILPNSQLASLGTRALAALLARSRKRFDVVLSVSKAAQAFARHRFKLDSEVLPNVFDYSLFHDAKSFPEYAEDSIKTILFLGRLVPRKGCRTLLEAVNLLAHDSTVAPFRVLVCGKGPLLSELQNYVHTHKLQKYVTFTGFVSVEDKPRYYASADISVFPSSGGESFGIVLLEAMASGKSAVLAGNNPGYASVMEDRPEQIFAATKAAELAAKIKTLLSNDVLRKEYALWGQDYSKKFDTNIIGKRLIEYYEQALRNHQ